MAKKRQPSSGQKRNQTKKQPGGAGSVLTWVTVGIVVISAAAVIFLFYPRSDDSQSHSRPGIPDDWVEMMEFQKQGELTFLSPEGEPKATIDIELADDDSKRQVGLMYRDTIPDSQGMLFIFPEEDVQQFWMRNTIISLDMIFVNAAREIVTIHKNTLPYSPGGYASNAPAQYVVEVAAGFTDRHNIRTGDKISW